MALPSQHRAENLGKQAMFPAMRMSFTHLQRELAHKHDAGRLSDTMLDRLMSCAGGSTKGRYADGLALVVLREFVTQARGILKAFLFYGCTQRFARRQQRVFGHLTPDLTSQGP